MTEASRSWASDAMPPQILFSLLNFSKPLPLSDGRRRDDVLIAGQTVEESLQRLFAGAGSPSDFHHLQANDLTVPAAKPSLYPTM